MMNDPQYTTLPIAPDVFWPLMLLLGVGLFSWLVVGLMPEREDGAAEKARGLDALVEQIGLTRGWVGPVVFALFILLAIVGVSLFELTRSYIFIEEFKPERFGIFASIVTAIFAGFFLGWRNLVLGRQASIQYQALLNEKINAANDKINAASEDLAARRQVTRVVHDKDGNETILIEWQDDLVTRAAAIDRLHGLAQERPEATPRIARQLSIYVRELSRERPPQFLQETLSQDDFDEWLIEKVHRHSDLEKAAQVLGRLQKIPGSHISKGDIDLRGCNLQRCDLRDLSFSEVSLQGAHLQGANLIGSDFSKADLSWANLRGSYLFGTAFLGSDLGGVDLQQTQIGFCVMNEATNLTDIDLLGAGLAIADDLTLVQLAPFWGHIFVAGVAENTNDGEFPAHWNEERLDPDGFQNAWRDWRDAYFNPAPPG